MDSCANIVNDIATNNIKVEIYNKNNEKLKIFFQKLIAVMLEALYQEIHPLFLTGAS